MEIPNEPVKINSPKYRKLLGYLFLVLIFSLVVFFIYKNQSGKQQLGEPNLQATENAVTGTKHPSYYGFLMKSYTADDNMVQLFFARADAPTTLYVGNFQRHNSLLQSYSRGRVYYTADADEPKSTGKHLLVGYYDIVNQKDVVLANLFPDPGYNTIAIRGNVIQAIGDELYFMVCDMVGTEPANPQSCKFDKVGNDKKIVTIKDFSNTNVSIFQYYAKSENSVVLEGPFDTRFVLNLASNELKPIDLAGINDLRVKDQKSDAANCGERPDITTDELLNLGCFNPSEVPLLSVPKGIAKGTVTLGQLQKSRKVRIFWDVINPITNREEMQPVVDRESYPGKYAFELPPGKYFVSIQNFYDSFRPDYAKSFTIENGKEVEANFNIP